MVIRRRSEKNYSSSLPISYHILTGQIKYNTIRAMKKSSVYKDLTLLGSFIKQYPGKPSREILETFPNKYPENKFLVEFSQIGEFTSICPVTGQPDFADIIIKYIPAEKLIEAKSLKIYLMAYRKEEDFGEFIANRIMEDIWYVCKPLWIEVTASFKPRGGIGWKTVTSKGKETIMP